ncbi:hypothetical protein DB347_20735 [Opitutaceae bacterium EW11]|nr:hypothetical protein DB347_20735 [Opitutaceae bacterium EW11]
MKMLESGVPGPEVIAGKPVATIEGRIINMHSGFDEKLLCTGPTFSSGTACVYRCSYCYVESMVTKLHAVRQAKAACGKEFQDLVIRRKDPVERVVSELTDAKGRPKYMETSADTVIFASPLVDVAATIELAQETAAICQKILELTPWQIRLLSKSNLLPRVAEGIPEKYRDRVIYGVSTGTLDDGVAKAIERGTALVSKRLESLHWLQDRGFRTFGMLCPSLPQTDYGRFSSDLAEMIRAEKCEHVWAEVLNSRGKAMDQAIAALHGAGLEDEADALQIVKSDKEAWEDYARATFEAHAQVFGDKLRFLQYVVKNTSAWWMKRKPDGALPLGAAAKESVALTVASDRVVKLTKDESNFLRSREEIVSEGVKASMAAAKALAEIYDYDDGKLWRAGGFAKFEDYCRARWGYERAHAYRLRECGAFVRQLEDSPIGDISLPTHESQVRPVLRLPEGDRLRVWKKVARGARDEQLTAKVVAEAAEEYAEAKGISLGTKKAPVPLKQRVAQALIRVDALVAKLPREEKKQFRALLEEMHALLE